MPLDRSIVRMFEVPLKCQVASTSVPKAKARLTGKGRKHWFLVCCACRFIHYHSLDSSRFTRLSLSLAIVYCFLSASFRISSYFITQFVAVFCLRQTMQKKAAPGTKAATKAARRTKAATAASASEM